MLGSLSSGCLTTVDIKLSNIYSNNWALSEQNGTDVGNKSCYESSVQRCIIYN